MTGLNALASAYCRTTRRAVATVSLMKFSRISRLRWNLR
jgi:hypothetical protein